MAAKRRRRRKKGQCQSSPVGRGDATGPSAAFFWCCGCAGMRLSGGRDFPLSLPPVVFALPARVRLTAGPNLPETAAVSTIEQPVAPSIAQPVVAASGRLLAVIYATTILISAFLLFQVQPLISKAMMSMTSTVRVRSCWTGIGMAARSGFRFYRRKERRNSSNAATAWICVREPANSWLRLPAIPGEAGGPACHDAGGTARVLTPRPALCRNSRGKPGE